MRRQSRVQVLWVDPRRILPLHEIRRGHHFQELVRRMMKHGWQGRPLAAEVLADGRLRPSGHFSGWTGTHRIAAAHVVVLRRPGFKVPVYLVNHGRPSRKPLVLKTTTDMSRYRLLRRRGDPAAALLHAELLINKVADAAGVL